MTDHYKKVYNGMLEPFPWYYRLILWARPLNTAFSEYAAVKYKTIGDNLFLIDYVRYDYSNYDYSEGEYSQPLQSPPDFDGGAGEPWKN